jgi:hypothetical protein
MQIVGNESASNTNLDADSQTLILSYNDRLKNNFNYSTSFNEGSSNLTNITNFDSEDVFAQQFLEGKTEGEKKQGIVKNIIKIPDMIILSLGVDEDEVTVYKFILLLILVTLLGFAAFRVAFGAGRV